MRKVLVAIATALAALAAAGHAHAAAPQTFTDPAGDSGAAPDVTQITVANDATGQYVFDVTFASDYGAGAVFSLYVDADQNPATGDPAHPGADFVITDSHLTHTFDVEEWDGGAWAHSAVQTASFKVAADNRFVAVSINRSELGNTNAFTFFASAGDGAAAADTTGTFTYAFQAQGTLALSFVTTKSVIRGRVWTVMAAIRRSDTDALQGSGGMIGCKSKLRVLMHSWVAPGGPASGTVAVCVFQLPAKKHIPVSATMTIAADGATTSKLVKTKS